MGVSLGLVRCLVMDFGFTLDFYLSSSENMLVFWFLLYKMIICFVKVFYNFHLLYIIPHIKQKLPLQTVSAKPLVTSVTVESLKENILANNLKPVYGVSFMKIEPVVWQEFRNKHTDIHTVRSLQYKMIHKNTAVRMQRQNIKKKMTEQVWALLKVEFLSYIWHFDKAREKEKLFTRDSQWLRTID